MRAATSGAKVVDIGGATVREVVGSLVAAYPALASQLLDGEGAINRFVNVFVNDTDVRHLGGLDTPVGDRDAVVLLPAMAGG
jgi:molybdopterin converting factor small subunit